MRKMMLHFVDNLSIKTVIAIVSGSTLRQKTLDLKMLGPGLLFAATSVGASHLVQSTRAGALYGLSLLGLILLANAVKYPTFRFANDYVASTGMTLLEAYRRQGKFILVIFFLITLSTLLYAVSALALLSAGLIKVVLPITLPTAWLALGLITATAILLIVGHYKALESVIKVLVILMVICTLIATGFVIPDIDWWGEQGGGLTLLPEDLDIAGLLFIAALIGWMPVPMDASVWQSIWSKAKRENSDYEPTVAEARFDFNLGYAGTILLAVCFLLMGTGLMHGKGIILESSSSAFSAQLIDLYKRLFGDYIAPFIGVAALAIVYSSLLAIMDAFPRTLSLLHRRLSYVSEREDSYKLKETSPFYIGVLIFMVISAAVTYQYFVTSMTALIDFAATTAFLTAPLIAILNYRAITSAQVPLNIQPNSYFKYYSLSCILLMSLFAVGYLYLRFY